MQGNWQLAMWPNGSGDRWAECLLIIGTGCRVQVFSLIHDSSVGLSAGIQSAGDWVSETPWLRILHSAEEDNLFPFDSKIACPCQSIEIKNKYAYRQSQVRIPNGSGVRWAECLLIIGTGCRVQDCSLILDSSVGLSAGIQSAGDWVSALGSNPAFSRGRQLVPFRFENSLPVPEHRN